MNEKDKVLLSSIDEMIKDAPNIGIMPLVFIQLKKEVERIIKERDEAIKKVGQ